MAMDQTKQAEEAELLADATLRGFVGYNLKRAYITIRNDLQKTLEGYGLRVTTFSALVLIIDSPDMTQTQLSAALDIERSSAVIIVDELENRDLISRNKVAGDRRTYALRATLAGVLFHRKVLDAVHRHEDVLLRKMTAAQRTMLIELLNMIEAADRS